MTILKVAVLWGTLKEPSQALVECSELAPSGKVEPVSGIKPYGGIFSPASFARDLLNSQSNLRKLISSRPKPRKFRRSIADNLSSKTVDSSIGDTMSTLRTTDDLRARLKNDDIATAKDIIYRSLMDEDRGPVTVHISKPVVVMKLLGKLLEEVGHTMYRDMLE